MTSVCETLNAPQQEAVRTTEGPLLILAGAGSGKTRTLTHRIAYLIEEKGVDPWHILAITFTNKAAEEMKSRVEAMTPEGRSVFVSTFHACCARILRGYADRLGYTKSFTIYDTEDQKVLMRRIIKDRDLDPKIYNEKDVLRQISSLKDEVVTADEYASRPGSFREQKIAELYTEYQKRLLMADAMDFDDLLVNTVLLFRENEDVLERYRDRFRYILVDEYQDTNTAQFEFVRLLAQEHRNLCVVGDDDQSIYKFRGANIGNILHFEEAFLGAKVIRLEQNYRSTKNILAAANQVISHNEGRMDKTLWSESCLRDYPGRMYFGQESRSWKENDAPKGVAFYDPAQTGETHMRLYKISRAQLHEVQAQEGLKPYWYGRLVTLGVHEDGCPIYTITSLYPHPRNAPSERYFNRIRDALTKECKKAESEADAYLDICRAN